MPTFLWNTDFQIYCFEVGHLRLVMAVSLGNRGKRGFSHHVDRAVFRCVDCVRDIICWSYIRRDRPLRRKSLLVYHKEEEDEVELLFASLSWDPCICTNSVFRHRCYMREVIFRYTMNSCWSVSGIPICWVWFLYPPQSSNHKYSECLCMPEFTCQFRQLGHTMDTDFWTSNDTDKLFDESMVLFKGCGLGLRYKREQLQVNYVVQSLPGGQMLWFKCPSWHRSAQSDIKLVDKPTYEHAQIKCKKKNSLRESFENLLVFHVLLLLYQKWSLQSCLSARCRILVLFFILGSLSWLHQSFSDSCSSYKEA